MSVCTRHLRFALLNHPFKNKAVFTKAELDPVIKVIRNGGKSKVPDDAPLLKYFSYVPELDPVNKVSDMDGDGDVDLKDYALYGMDRLTYEGYQIEKHDEAVKRIEDIAISAGMTKLDRSELFEVNLGSAVVSPPSGDALISVFVRGHRLCRQRVRREETLRRRLAHISKLKTMLGLSEVKVDNMTLEMVSDNDFALLKLPIRLFRAKVEHMLRKIRMSIENKLTLTRGSEEDELKQIEIEKEDALIAERKLLQSRREIYEHVLIMRKDSQTGEILFIKLFKDVPRHKVTLLIPTHNVAIASSEQFFLLSLIGAGSVMPTYRSIHFALEQPWVANLVVGSLAASILKIVYSSFQNSHAYLALDVHRYSDEYISASGGYSVFSVIHELAEEVENNATLLAYVVQKLNKGISTGGDAAVAEWLAEVFPERTACERDWATKVPVVSATSRLFALGLCTHFDQTASAPSDLQE